MIRVLALFLLTGAFLAGQEPSRKKTAPAKPASKQKAPAKAMPAAISIPAGAREVEPGIFLQVDESGKRWLYRKTPFGVARWEDKQEQTEQSGKAQLDSATAVEDGDVIRFSRPGPFGEYKWTKKKDELDAEERRVWERQQERTAKSNEPKPE